VHIAAAKLKTGHQAVADTDNMPDGARKRIHNFPTNLEEPGKALFMTAKTPCLHAVLRRTPSLGSHADIRGKMSAVLGQISRLGAEIDVDGG
jgi:hypothetical protein